MPVRPPKRPTRVDALGSLNVNVEDEATSRAIDALTDALGRQRQAATTPTVNRLTLNGVTPLTNIELSIYTDGTDAWFIDGDGNRIQLTSNGAVNAGGGGGGSSTVTTTTYWYSPVWTAGNVLDTRGPTNDQCRAIYMGRAPQALSSIRIYWGQTAGGTMTYAEMGIATGTFSPGTEPTLTLRGFVDAASDWGSAANRLKAITVTGADIAAGDDIWACYSVNFSAGTPTIAVSNVSDRLDTCAIVRRNSCRISTNLNTPLAFVIDPGATPAWIAFALP
jgi:hypothetical protein